MAEEDLYGAAFDFGGEWQGGAAGEGAPGPDGAPADMTYDYSGYENAYGGAGDVDLIVENGAVADDEFASDALKNRVASIGQGRLSKYQQWKDTRLRKPTIALQAAGIEGLSGYAGRRGGAASSIFEELGVPPPSIGEVILPPDDHMTIFDIDPSKYETQPWTVPNADLVRWFNFGLNEHTWREYARRQRAIRKELKQLMLAHVAAHGLHDPPIQLSSTFETALAASAKMGNTAMPVPHVLAQSGISLGPAGGMDDGKAEPRDMSGGDLAAPPAGFMVPPAHTQEWQPQPQHSLAATTAVGAHAAPSSSVPSGDGEEAHARRSRSREDDSLRYRGGRNPESRFDRGPGGAGGRYAPGPGNMYRQDDRRRDRDGPPRGDSRGDFRDRDRGPSRDQRWDSGRGGDRRDDRDYRDRDRDRERDRLPERGRDDRYRDDRERYDRGRDSRDDRYHGRDRR